MTFAPTKLACAVATVGLGAALISGCGNDVPTNGVAKVDDSVIKRDEFNKWLSTASKGQAQGAPAGAVPDPPNFTKCVAARQKQPVPKGQTTPSAASLKKQCKTEYDQLKNEVMQFLVQAEWLQQEADTRGVKVSTAEVKKSFEDRKKQEFPNDKAYQSFLKQSGMSEDDILFRLKLEILQRKLVQKVTEKETKVTEADVSSYYDKNKKRFAQPQRRDINVVLTKTEAKANEAKKALDGGDSFKAVAKKYSIDEASKSQGGKLPDVVKGQQEQALDKAVFAAKKSKVTGPVKTQFGYYVFEVSKISAASQQTLEQSKETIRNLLRSQRQQKAVEKFARDFREEYKEKTVCADDFRIAECKNAPKEKTNTGPASGGTPGGAQPQGGTPVPQEGGGAQQVPVPQEGGGAQQVPPQQVPQQQAPQQQVPPQQVPQQQAPPSSP